MSMLIVGALEEVNKSVAPIRPEGIDATPFENDKN